MGAQNTHNYPNLWPTRIQLPVAKPTEKQNTGRERIT
jgi:hypothetical protein